MENLIQETNWEHSIVEKSDNNFRVIQKDGKYGIIRKDGTFILQPEYSGIADVVGVDDFLHFVKDGNNYVLSQTDSITN